MTVILASCNSKPAKEISFNLPDDFAKIYHKNNDNGSFDKEYAREGESLQSWTEIIRYIYQPVDVNLREQFSALVKIMANSCNEPFAPQPIDGTIGGYNAINALFACGAKDGVNYGEITQYIFIHGDNGVHSLQRAMRIEKFKAKDTQKIIKKELKPWDEFFRSVEFK
ncbi:MAG: hypothetical protein HRT47_06125 [Candidatus Caenarcaniphilales bacterium]|nr:hypothetical protein [Candidatus Caenarcaniphilales bacterium]